MMEGSPSILLIIKDNHITLWLISEAWIMSVILVPVVVFYPFTTSIPI